jgi:tRNA U38,U39,U40 pseudouridine synthase TruA
LAQLTQIIAAKDRSAAPGTAPASGLYLEAVAYDDTPLNAATPRP